MLVIGSHSHISATNEANCSGPNGTQPRSTSPSRTARRIRSGATSVRLTRTPGASSRKSASTSATTSLMTIGSTPMRRSPTTPSPIWDNVPAIRSRSASSRPPLRSRYNPALVGRTPWAVRSSSRTPSSRSSFEMARLNGGWVMSRFLAAWDTEPASATALKYSSCRKSMVPPFALSAPVMAESIGSVTGGSVTGDSVTGGSGHRPVEGASGLS